MVGFGCGDHELWVCQVAVLKFSQETCDVGTWCSVSKASLKVLDYRHTTTAGLYVTIRYLPESVLSS